MTFTSFSYVCFSFLRLRWPDETSSCVLLALITVVTIVFFLLARYLLYPPVPLALAIEVCLAGVMLTVAAPVDLVLGLTLIVATPRTPISISLKYWWFSLLKLHTWLYTYFVFTWLYTDNMNILRLVFCQKLCKIIHNVCLFCCKFLMNVEEIRSY